MRYVATDIPRTRPGPHPWYGPCDGFGADGSCSECTGSSGCLDPAFTPCLGPEPFATTPCCDNPEHEERLTREMANRAPDQQGLANRVGVHPEDFRGFVEGRTMLTAPARERIRAALSEKAPACEAPAYEIPATTRYPEGPRTGFSGYLRSDAPACSTCEAIMVRRGEQFRCVECGQRAGAR